MKSSLKLSCASLIKPTDDLLNLFVMALFVIADEGHGPDAIMLAQHRMLHDNL
jgi:hypothetical protein